MNYAPTYSHPYIYVPRVNQSCVWRGLQEDPRDFWIFILAPLLFVSWLCLACLILWLISRRLKAVVRLPNLGGLTFTVVT